MKTGQKTLNNIVIENYVIEHTTADATCRERITYKVRNDLKRTKSKKLESIFYRNTK